MEAVCPSSRIMLKNELAGPIDSWIESMRDGRLVVVDAGRSHKT